MSKTRNDGREDRVLAKPLIQAGERREPGETVRLRPDQIERLEGDGYFEAAKAPARKPSPAKDAPEGEDTKEKAS